MAQEGEPRTYILRYYENLKNSKESYVANIYEMFDPSTRFPEDAGKTLLDRIVGSTIPILAENIRGRGHKFDSEDIISTIPAAIGTKYYINTPLDLDKLQKFSNYFKRLSS